MVITPVSVDTANSILDGRHYLGPMGYRPYHCLTDESQQALAVYSPPVASAFKEHLEGSVELARLFKFPTAQFQTSQFLSGTLRWLRKNTKAPVVFSYADPTARNSVTGAAHQGTVYRASGFTCLGPSRATDVWLTKGGERITSPQAYRMFKTKAAGKIRAALQDPGLVDEEYRPRAIAAINRYGTEWTLVPGEPKILYVYPLRLGLKGLAQRFEQMHSRYAESLRPIAEGTGGGTPDSSVVRRHEAAPMTSPAE